MTISTTTHDTGKTTISCVECPLCNTEITDQGSLAKHLRHDCEVNNESE